MSGALSPHTASMDGSIGILPKPSSGIAFMNSVQQQVHAVQVRQQRQWLWECASTGVLAGGIAGCVLAIGRILSHGAFSSIWIMLAVAVPAAAGVVVALVRSKSLQCAARLIDNQCNFKDRTQTALQFLQKSDNDPLRRLQIEDAKSHLKSVDPSKVTPISAPRSWRLGIIASFVAVLLALVSGKPEPLMASVVSNSVVTEQASRASDGLEELEQFQKEQNDPELDKMLKEMNEQLKMLTEPGLDPKEALAKLSEMEAALQEMQKQLSDPTTEAQMQEIGEALSLAEATAAAGQAMSKGEMEKAADELAKMEMPEMDRKTEKALIEKLEQAQRKSGDSSNKKNDLKEALEKLTQGLSSGSKSKFQDGSKGLASECKKQGQKKKLSDLLKKQCQCLGECKSECESECRNQAQGNKKGGNKAGKGTAGNPEGEKTAKSNTSKEMKLTGQDSGSGEVETETTSNPEQEQEAVRQYREAAEKYEALSESALESESIPMGHRQVIRRYFEMIRPQGNETDAVNDKTAPAESQE